MKTLPFYVQLLLALGISALVCFAMTPLVRKTAVRVGAVDIPTDGRRMHDRPIPRLGGLAIVFSVLLTVVLLVDLDRQMRGILLGAMLVAVLGALDDCLTLRASFKFVVQILAACIVVLHGCTIQYISNPIFSSSVQYLDLGNWSIPITIIWIVAITNAVNFIDGLDGLAAGVSAISAATLLAIALLVSEGDVALAAAAVLGACLGFLPYNFNPAKIFMGDIGSTFLGFVFASLSVRGLFKLYAVISFAVPFLILGIPIFDICFAVIRRLLKRQSPMKPDRGHIHHRLIDMGFSQKQAVAITYMLTAILGLAAVLLTSSGSGKALILIGAVIVVGAIGLRLIFAYPDGKGPHEKPPNEENRES